ncbi:unnamed protein product, partial [Ectocarpus fasciculatus]
MWANVWQLLGASMLPMFTVGTGLDMAGGAEESVIAVRDGVVVQV